MRFFQSDTFENENFPETKRQGAEFGARIRRIRWLAIWGNYGYMRPLLRTALFSNDIPGVPRHKGLGSGHRVPKGFLLSGKSMRRRSGIDQ